MAAALLTATPCSVARADAPAPASIPDLEGARSLALGAYRGIIPGNDGIFFNSASLAADRRYEVEAQWFLDRASNENALESYTLSVVDSTSPSFTGGAAFTHVLSGPWTGNLFHVPLATQISPTAFLGVTPKYQSLDGPGGDQIRAFNVDASLFLKPSSLVGFGAAGYNLLRSGHKMIQPRGVGIGLSVGDEARYHLGFDWRGDFDRQDRLTSALAVGVEYLVGDMLPVRASFVKDDTRSATFWSVGAGIVTTGGFALDLSYRQRIEDPQEFTVAAALKLFLPAM
jgi:hypothetical protein